MKNLSHASRNRFQTTRVSGRGTGPEACHSAWSFFISSAVLIQSVDSASASARTHQVELDLEVGLALDGAGREELARLGLDRIGGLAVAVPQRLRLRARRLGRLLPALLDVVQLARRLLHVLGLVEVVLLRQRLGLRDHLFLDGGVREPLPLVHLAQLVELRPEHGQRRLQALDQVLALVVRQRQRRLDRGAEIARRLVRFLQREVVGLGALVRALDQLIDALHLLAERLLGGGLLRLGALADRRFGGGVALLDRFVEPLGLLEQPAPLARHRVPRVGGAVFLRRELLGLARQLLEPGVGLRALLAVLVPGAGARARLLEPLHELLVDVRFRIRGQPFPLGPRLLEPIERIVAVDRLDHARRATRGRRAAGRELRLRAASCSARSCASRSTIARAAADRALEARALGGGDLVGRRREQLAPRRLGLVELPSAPAIVVDAASASTRAIAAATRCWCCSSTAFRAASASSMAWTIARARLATDLFLARSASPSSVARSSAPPAAARSSAPTPASLWSVLVAMLRSSAWSCDPLGGERRGAGVGGVARDRAQRLHVGQPARRRRRGRCPPASSSRRRQSVSGR